MFEKSDNLFLMTWYLQLNATVVFSSCCTLFLFRSVRRLQCHNERFHIHKWALKWRFENIFEFKTIFHSFFEVDSYCYSVLWNNLIPMYWDRNCWSHNNLFINFLLLELKKEFTLYYSYPRWRHDSCKCTGCSEQDWSLKLFVYYKHSLQSISFRDKPRLVSVDH